MRIAMWSGPRNLSTAMMYSFGNRADTAVWDEPFYAAYLKATGIDHPMRAETLAAGETDPLAVAKSCLGSSPEGKAVFYQKHMTHHMLPDFPLDWLDELANVFLIRRPDRVIASYHAKRENPVLDDIGFRQQAEIYDRVVATGQTPVVIDSDDILSAPEAALRALCTAIGLSFSADMLHWPRGGHRADGAWAPHWYGSVWQSAGFAKGVSAPPVLTPAGQKLCKNALPYYQHLAKKKLTIPI